MKTSDSSGDGLTKPCARALRSIDIVAAFMRPTPPASIEICASMANKPAKRVVVQRGIARAGNERIFFDQTCKSGGSKMRCHWRLIAVLGFVMICVLGQTRTAGAATATATVNSINATGVGRPLGTVTFSDSTGGLVITPKLSGLSPGEHGFHIHEKGDCRPGLNQRKSAAGFAAGGHYDPGHTRTHLGPFNTAGHRGDLPVLTVDSRGDATQTVTAPHLTVAQIRGRSIMIHAGGDNYSDSPLPLGGGGARIACGVIR
jgi:superoxide dismutase, Cu-Zn family